MNQMLAPLLVRLRDLGKRIDALTLKERLLLVAAALLLLVYGWNQWFLGPLEAQRAALVAERDAVSQELSRFDALTIEWSAAAAVDPDAESKQRMESLTRELAEISATIEQRAGRMVPPEQMPEVLHKVLSGLSDLRFESLEGLPTQPVIAEAEPGAATTTGATQPAAANTASARGTTHSAYRHGFRIRFSGSYRAVTQYLQELEKLPFGFFWDELSLDAKEFPQLRGSLVVYTVSLNQGWIGV
jgi:MSHA biogenesis protein MshJ